MLYKWTGDTDHTRLAFSPTWQPRATTPCCSGPESNNSPFIPVLISHIQRQVPWYLKYVFPYIQTKSLSRTQMKCLWEELHYSLQREHEWERCSWAWLLPEAGKRGNNVSWLIQFNVYTYNYHFRRGIRGCGNWCTRLKLAKNTELQVETGCSEKLGTEEFTASRFCSVDRLTPQSGIQAFNWGVESLYASVSWYQSEAVCAYDLCICGRETDRQLVKLLPPVWSRAVTAELFSAFLHLFPPPVESDGSSAAKN